MAEVTETLTRTFHGCRIVSRQGEPKTVPGEKAPPSDGWLHDVYADTEPETACIERSIPSLAKAIELARMIDTDRPSESAPEEADGELSTNPETTPTTEG